MEIFEDYFAYLSSFSKEELRKKYAKKEFTWLFLKTMLDRKLISRTTFEYVVQEELK